MSDAENGRFFSKNDWRAAAISGGGAFLVYALTLAPSVTLEDSGELVTAAHGWGVPHPPGYPTWTILTGFFLRIFPFGNMAWRAALASAIFGATACALLALLVSRTARAMAAELVVVRENFTERAMEMLILAASVSAGLFLATSPGLWSQAVIAEVYSLNTLFFLATAVLLCRWMMLPRQLGYLYAATLVFALGLGNHQTLLLLLPAVFVLVFFVSRKVFNDLVVTSLVVGQLGLYLLAWLATPEGVTFSKFFSEPTLGRKFFWGGVLSNLAFPIYRALVARGAPKWFPNLPWKWRVSAKRVAILSACIIVGLSVYAYLPLASATNPPMNWGYCQARDGFFHHLTRGQYEKLEFGRSLPQFWGQINWFFDELHAQFTLFPAALALMTLAFYFDLGKKMRQWLMFTLAAFLCFSLGFLILENPTFERAKAFSDRVFFILAHCVYAVWIGYGMVTGAMYVGSRWRGKWRDATLCVTMVALVFVAPDWSTVWRKISGKPAGPWSDVVRIFGAWRTSEQAGHDFGYEFGRKMFAPGGGYPEMERGAVLFGGTDPGRFVPTYMIFVESRVPPRAKYRDEQFDRSDVYLITQNALADATYLRYIRDHYDGSRPKNNAPVQKWLGRDRAYPSEPLWLPGKAETELAFQMYVKELLARPRLPGEEVTMVGGRLRVKGAQAVMSINGILSRMIFERNKHRHAFYVEESYRLAWMYPHLEPYGIILRLNAEPIPELSPQIVARDRAYWDDLSGKLLSNPKFLRDDIAQKTFSKLRAAVGSLYAFRRMFAEAEYAYLQAVALCPAHAETTFRLVELYVELDRFDDAMRALVELARHDPYNQKLRDALGQVAVFRQLHAEQRQLEQQRRERPTDFDVAFKLAAVYGKRQKFQQMDEILSWLLEQPSLPTAEFMHICQLYIQLNQLDRVAQLLKKFTESHPDEAIGWYNFALVQTARGRLDEAMTALERAYALDPKSVGAVVLQDPRLAALRATARFQQLFSGQAVAPPMR
jgi:tetratricopeptide (TPR) repeat protein